MTARATKDTWREILRSAFDIFDDLERKGFGATPFVLGGGTVLIPTALMIDRYEPIRACRWM